MKRGDAHNSLPPQVSGAMLGKLAIRVPKIIFHDKRQENLTAFRVEFRWWGDVSDRPVWLAIPWKPGQIIDEATFPLVVGPTALKGYFHDMGNELELRVFDANVLYGTAYLPLDEWDEDHLSFCKEIPINKPKSRNEAQLQVEVNALYKTYDMKNNKRGGMAKKLDKENLITTFEKMEALVKTDSSQKYVEWPDYQIMASSGRKEPHHQQILKASSGIEKFKLDENKKQASAERLRALATYTQQSKTEKIKTKNGDSSILDEVNTFGNAAQGERLQKSDKTTGVMHDYTFHEDEAMREPPNKNSVLPTHLLSKAESLLLKVKKTTSSIQSKNATEGTRNNAICQELNINFPEFVANSDRLSARLKKSLVPDDLISYKSGGMDLNFKGNELDWLLRGVPEAYDDDVMIDDEVVEKLIKEGGKPPSQLHFPSLYAASQKTLLNLEKVKILSFTISDISVYSARFGLRKESSYLVIRCPAGCTIEENYLQDHTVPSSDNTQVVTLDLTERDPLGQVVSNRRKNMLKDYFVGSKKLNIHTKWNICISDALLSDWLHAADSPPISSLIHIDVYSYLLPPTGKNSAGSSRILDKKGWSSSSLLLGSTDISLQALLGSSTLSCFVSSDIMLDQASYLTISDRLKRLPNYTRMGNGNEQNLTKLGNIKCKLSLLDACSKPVDSEGMTNTTSQKSSKQVSSVMQHEPTSAFFGVSDSQTIIDDALNFVPGEVSHVKKNAISCATGHINSKAVSIGIAIHSVSRQDDASSWMSHIPPSGVTKLRVSYKIALADESVRDFVESAFSTRQLLSKLDIDISSGHLHQFSDILSWRFIYFEVWICWRDEKYLDEKRHLLGLAKYPVGSDIGAPTALSVVDPISGSRAGTIRVTLIFNESNDVAQASLEKCLTSEHIRDVLLRDFTDDNSLEIPSKPQNQIVAESLQEHDTVDIDPPDPAASVIHFMQDERQHMLDIAEEKKAPNKPVMLPKRTDDEPQLKEDIPNHTRIVRLSADIAGPLQMSSDSLLNDRQSHQSIEDTVVSEEEKAVDLKIVDESKSDSKQIIERPHAQLGDVMDESNLNDDVIHILDISIMGDFREMTEVISAHFPHMKSALGCYVCYSFPGLLDEATNQWNAIRVIRGGRFNEERSIWWDRDCSILNSRNRHEFSVKTGRSSLSVLGLENLSDKYADGSLTFQVIPSDSEGNMPSSPKSIGTFSLSFEVFETILSRAGCSQVITLPIRFADSEANVKADVNLSISHRICPPAVKKNLHSQEYDAKKFISGESILDTLITPQTSNWDKIALTVTVDCLSLTPSNYGNIHDGRKVYISCSSTDNPSPLQSYPTTHLNLFKTPVRALRDFSSHCNGNDNFAQSVLLQPSLLETPSNVEDLPGQCDVSALRQVTFLFTLHARPDWMSDKNDETTSDAYFSDENLGTAVVSLYPLALGYPRVSGWYYISDPSGQRIGQMKVTVCPQSEDTLRCPRKNHDDSSGKNLVDLPCHYDDNNTNIEVCIGSNFQDVIADLEACILRFGQQSELLSESNPVDDNDVDITNSVSDIDLESTNNKNVDDELCSSSLSESPFLLQQTFSVMESVDGVIELESTSNKNAEDELCSSSLSESPSLLQQSFSVMESVDGVDNSDNGENNETPIDLTYSLLQPSLSTEDSVGGIVTMSTISMDSTNNMHSDDNIPDVYVDSSLQFSPNEQRFECAIEGNNSPDVLEDISITNDDIGNASSIKSPRKSSPCNVLPEVDLTHISSLDETQYYGEEYLRSSPHLLGSPTPSLEAFLLDIRPDVHDIFEEFLKGVENSTMINEGRVVAKVEFETPLVDVLFQSLPVKIHVEDVVNGNDDDVSSCENDGMDTSSALANEDVPPPTSVISEVEDMDLDSNRDNDIHDKTDAVLDENIQALNTFTIESSPSCEKPSLSAGLCLCSKCAKQPPFKGSGLLKFQRHEGNLRQPLRTSTYKESLENDLVEVNGIIQTAMAASGIKPTAMNSSASHRSFENFMKSFAGDQTLKHDCRASTKSRKEILDAETERISRIMLGSMIKYTGSTSV